MNVLLLRDVVAILLAGDHIYKMDYGRMLDVHIARGARLTVGAIEVPLAEAGRFGIHEVDSDARVVLRTRR